MIGPYRDPVLTVKSGDTVVAHTVDAFEQKITDESVKPSSIATLPYVNPLVGPIAVEGAEPGDALAVQVISIDPVGPQPRGVTCLQKYFGLLSPTASALSEPFPEIVKMVEVTTEGIVWDEDIVFPYEPFIGTIGTAPKIEAVNSLTPSNHGGNMDLPDVAPGSTIYLPVRAGRVFYLVMFMHVKVMASCAALPLRCLPCGDQGGAYKVDLGLAAVRRRKPDNEYWQQQASRRRSKDRLQ